MSNLFSRLSLRANIVTVAMACVLLVACGDGDTSLAPRDSDGSSSSICEDCDDSSSSVKSSSSAKSSTSRHCEDCKDEAISSSSFAGKKTAWDHLNPEIDYGEMVDERDAQTYKTVKIGDQVWMAENLNYETANSWCGGGNGENEGDCSKYGRLYTWTATIDVCPSGWHLPDTTEWNKLFTAVGGRGSAGKILRSQTGWNSSNNGTDAYGFSAFPAGYRDFCDYFDYVGRSADFWGATEYDSDDAYSMYLSYYDEYVNLYNDYKGNAYSVRCLKD